MVPNPKPEKKVSMETPKATKDKISISISGDFEPGQMHRYFLKAMSWRAQA